VPNVLAAAKIATPARAVGTADNQKATWKNGVNPGSLEIAAPSTENSGYPLG
jgi:hypothetical protein